MKSVKYFFGVSLILAGMNLIAQEGYTEQIVVPLSNPGESGTLIVGLVNGSISVLGYDGNEIILDAMSKGSNKVETDKSEGMTKLTAASFELSATEKDNVVEIESDSWKRSINLQIKVPKNFDLELSTVNDGKLKIENINGKISAENVNGSIRMNQVSGSVLANTVNGEIDVLFNTIFPDDPMVFTTLNGDIDVTFPGSLKASVKLKSDMGEIFTDFDIDVTDTKPKVKKTEDSGTYKVSIEDWIYGKINGGGPEFTFKNFNGDIYIRMKK